MKVLVANKIRDLSSLYPEFMVKIFNNIINSLEDYDRKIKT